MDVEAPWKVPCPAAGASPWRLHRLFGDDTHAVVAQPKWASGHGPHSVCVNRVGGLRAWPIDRCLNKDAGENERKTPTLCECQQAKREREREREGKKQKKKEKKALALGIFEPSFDATAVEVYNSVVILAEFHWVQEGTLAPGTRRLMGIKTALQQEKMDVKLDNNRDILMAQVLSYAVEHMQYHPSEMHMKIGIWSHAFPSTKCTVRIGAFEAGICEACVAKRGGWAN